MGVHLIVDNTNDPSKKPWSTKEIKLFEDLADARRQSGLDTVVIEGVSDDGHPWISVVNEKSARIAIHCARHPHGGYIIFGDSRRPIRWLSLCEMKKNLLNADCVR